MDAYEQMQEALEWAQDAIDNESSNVGLHDGHIDDATQWAIIAQAQQLARIADALESLNRTLGNRTE